VAAEETQDLDHPNQPYMGVKLCATFFSRTGAVCVPGIPSWQGPMRPFSGERRLFRERLRACRSEIDSMAQVIRREGGGIGL
jgi:hypothetical protein